MARVAPPRRRLLEPTSFLLDQFTAALCLVWGARLLRLAAVGPVRLLWAGMLLATAAAAVAGGIKHGYFSAVDTPLRRVVWRFTCFSGGLVSSLLLAAVILLQLPAASHLPALGLAAGELVGFVIWVSNKADYRAVMLHYVPSAGTAVVVLLLTPWTSFTPWVLGATGSAALAGLAQAPAVRLHRHFNHNDFAHVISLISLWLLYRAGLLAGAGGAG